MSGNRYNLVFTILGAFAAFLPASNANATCAANAAGTWNFFALADREPAINSVIANVRNASGNGPIAIRVLPSGGVTFVKDSAKVIKCVLTISADGSFSSAPCTSYGDQGGSKSMSVGGNLTFASPTCDLSGTVSIPGENAVTIRGGHVNGAIGAGIATQGKQVLSFTLVEN